MRILQLKSLKIILFLFLAVSNAYCWSEDLGANYGDMEVGAGIVSQTLADYRGSNRYQVYALPIPYFLYNGRYFKSDKRGVRGEFWANAYYELNVSFDGSVNGKSDNNPLRKGMPELESAFEVGPSFDVNLSGDDFSQGWSARLPLRGVFSVGKKGVDYIGVLFNPRLTWREPDLFYGYRAALNIGLLYADQSYHDYYYSVAPAFVTEDRPMYIAKSGYSGSYMRFSLYKHWVNWRLGLSLRYDYLGGAAFLDSPMVETKHFASLSLGLTRTFWRSKR